MALIIQKYGGTSVANAERVKEVAKRVVKYKKAGHDVIVVVSAPAGRTDALVKRAYELSDTPNKREFDMLLTSGEQISIASLAIAVADGPSAAHRILVQLYMQPIRFNRCASTRDEPLRSLVALRLDIEVALDRNDRAVLIIAYAKSTAVAALHVNLQRIRRDLYAILAVVVHTENEVAAVADQGQLMLPCIDIERLFWIGCCCDDAVIGASANRRVLRELVIAGRRLDIGRLVLGNFLLRELRGELRLRLLPDRRGRRRRAARIASLLVAEGDLAADGGRRQALANRELAQKFVLSEALIGQLIGKCVEHRALIACRYAGAVSKESKDILRPRRLVDDDIAGLERRRRGRIVIVDGDRMSAVLVHRDGSRILLIDDAALFCAFTAEEVLNVASANIAPVLARTDDFAYADILDILIVALIAGFIEPFSAIFQVEIRVCCVDNTVQP